MTTEKLVKEAIDRLDTALGNTDVSGFVWAGIRVEMITLAKLAWLEATRQAYADSANILTLSRSEALLMAGEMTEQEWRTAKAILIAMQSKIRATMKKYDNEET